MTRVTLDVSAVPSKPAGAGRYIVEMARHLSAYEEIDLVLLARHGDAERWPQIAPAAELHAVAPDRRPLRLAWEQAILPGLLRRYKSGLHIGPHYTVPERSSVPKVATIHDMTFFDHPEWHESTKVKVFRHAISAAAKKAKCVAVSHHTASQLRNRFPDVDVTPIPLGVDHDRFRVEASGDDAQLLARHGIAGDFIAFVGTIEPRKDVPTLLSAFDNIASQHPTGSLVVAGQMGWEREAFESALAQMQHSDRVVLPGYLPDDAIPALLRQAKCVAYPSLSEGFGLPALEALACGVPLVTTRGSAMEEVVGDAAMLVDPGDVTALSGALEVLLNDGAHAEKLRAAGPATAAPYTWSATATAHADLIRIAADA